MFESLTNKEKEEILPDGTMILLGYRGSVAHGMFVPSTDPNSFDDIDLMGVYVATVTQYFGFGNKDVHDRFIKEWDVVSYELRKFAGLLAKSNPNVISMLWLKPDHYLQLTEAGQSLLDNRELFSSKLAYHSFAGYANGQLKRMTHLNQGALTDINNRRQILEQRGVNFEESGKSLLPAGATKDLVEVAKQYEDLRSRYFSGYMGNKRKQLVEEHGYDTKNAAHLIRLLRMAVEFLEDGVMRVWRDDAEELLAIKKGKHTLAQVQEEAEDLFAKARTAYENSPLPETVDQEKIEQLCINILEAHFDCKGC